MASTLRSRRHRNPQQTTETPQGEQQKPFFSGRQATPSVQSKEKSNGAFFQPKLQVGQTGDKYEREADAIADNVVNRPSYGAENTPSVQRLATPDEKNMPATNDGRMAQDKMIQEKAADSPKKEEEKPNVQKAEAKKEEEKPNVQKAEAKKEEEKPNVQKAEAKKEEDKPNVQKAEAKKEEEKPNVQKAEGKDKGTPRNNEAQNKQFNDAVQEIQRKIGRKLSEGEKRRLHQEISGQNFSYQEIVAHGITMFRKKYTLFMAKTAKQKPQNNALPQLLRYLTAVVEHRLRLYFNQPASTLPILADLATATDPLSIFIKQHKLSNDELVALLIGVAPHFKADFFDTLIQPFFERATDFPQIGGVRGKQFRGFLPTGETVLFVLAGEDWQQRQHMMQLFADAHLFRKQNILTLEAPLSSEPPTSGLWRLEDDWAEYFTTGHASKPRFSNSFPAERLDTPMEWTDLVLPDTTKNDVNELRVWLQHGNTLLEDWKMNRILKPGYRALFHGVAGTGKTLTAALLGKETGRDVYRVDLSRVVSKFIGETEKNLSNLFDRAENKDWILFFDEADALFGKRTGVRDAHDRYANQEVSFLLQRVETFNGLVILASNFKSNIDDAFIRRFQSIIQFPIPRIAERLQLWRQSLPAHIRLGDDVNLQILAEKYELTGASIVNIIQFCCLRAIARNNLTLTLQDFREGIAREFSKEGKIFN